ncbi:MAG TPA: helix-turn-helix transcriptional regulator [Bacteroidia bacterium]|nr:helix-turn-helix transcriptional regulator [Bacteroidia bacterium]
MINNRNKKLLTKFGKHLRKLRLEQGLSQEELNHRTDLSKNMVGMIERGEVNPTLTTIHLLAQGLGIPKEELMNFD